MDSSQPSPQDRMSESQVHDVHRRLQAIQKGRDVLLAVYRDEPELLEYGPDTVSLVDMALSIYQNIDRMMALPPGDVDMQGLGGYEAMLKAVNTVISGILDGKTTLDGEARARMKSFKRWGNLEDLEEAIIHWRRAVDLSTYNSHDKAVYLNNLGNALTTRFDRRGLPVDLDHAISNKRAAVSLAPDGHPGKPRYLNSLGDSLEMRFNLHGVLMDLEEAISSKRAAISLTADSHPSKPMYLNNLGILLQTRFEYRGSLVDLEDAISTKRAAVSLTPDDHPNKPTYLLNLGNALHTRFNRHGSLADLENAISIERVAVSLVPDGHPNKPTYLNSLGSVLQKRFHRKNSLVDLQDAISSFQAAVNLTPESHPDRPRYLNSIGAAFQMRFDRYRSLLDLENAISSLREALCLIPDRHPIRQPCHHNLGLALEKRFDHSSSIADLEDAVSNHWEAVTLVPQGHSSKPSSLYSLAGALTKQYKYNGEQQHLRVALLAAKEIAETLSTPSMWRLHGALLWAHCSAMVPATAIPAFKCAIGLLPQVAWLGLAVDDQYALLAEVGNAVREAVAATVAEGDCITAVEWAEQGRSIVWQNLLSLRTPLDALQVQYPALAGRLQEISRQLEHPTEKADNQIKLGMERDRLIDEVRTMPGFGGFLNPKSIEELAPAAREGPIVFLNLGQARCDALILLTDDKGAAEALSIHLERVTLQKTDDLCNRFVSLLRQNGVRAGGPIGSKVKDAKTSFKYILRVLWLDYVQPIIDRLAYSVNLESPPRLWWCTTGPLAFLPIHAAGIYDTNDAGHKLSDYVVSSYTPTLTALLDSPHSIPPDVPKFLTIAMSETSGQSPLPNTEEEVEKVHRFAANLPVVALKNEEATEKRVLEELEQSSWVHLACHGEQVGGKPMESGLIFHDGKLEMSELIKTRLPRADFAFLSACQTAVGDGGVPEESAHLAAGMLFVGYRGLVATMWSIEDQVAPRVAEDVYRYLFRHGQPKREEAAYALHRAIRSLQESGVPFISWTPFIHVGR